MIRSAKHLRIGLDYHGVINDNPAYFKEFCAEALSRGNEIHILSGGPKEKIIQKLRDIGLKYTKIFTLIDYYEEQGQVILLADGSWHIEDSLWNKTKADYCRKNHISVQIDDSAVYGFYFTTPFCLYNKETNTCTLSLNQEVINLSQHSAKEAVKRLEEILA